MKNVSKIIEFPLDSTRKINVKITKKHMKNIRLAISKSGEVAVSIPTHTSYSYAYEFLVRKREWISTQLVKILSNVKKDSCHFVNNGNLFMFGNNYNLNVQQSSKNKVIFDNQFTIDVKENSPEYVKAVFVKWCKIYFLDFLTNRLCFVYRQIFKDENIPQIKIKTMKSMWGNCDYVKRIITLNLYLIKTPVSCIDYVITHELAHLIYHDHSKNFHNLLDQLLPDWKARKKQLNNYSLQF